MYKNILLAVDDSEQAGRAVAAARDLAKLSGGTVQVLHVRERQVVIGKGGGSFDVEDSEQVRLLVQRHAAETDSPVAARLLASWDREVREFVKVMPRDYRRILEATKLAEAQGRPIDQAVCSPCIRAKESGCAGGSQR